MMKTCLKLTLLAALALASTATAQVDFVKDIQPVLEVHCTKCHGEDGRGQTKAGKKLDVKDYTDAKVQADS